MRPKNARMQTEYFATFQDPSVIASYQYRPPFPPEVFIVLSGLITDMPRRVLDLGCGTGFVARELLPFVDSVDAVDVSAGMIEVGKQLPGGDDARLRWILGRAEEAPIDPPYALITAGDSLHGMDWPVLMLRLREMLTANGHLAIFENGQEPPPWQAELQSIILRYSPKREYTPFNLIDELVRLGLFTIHGGHRTAPVPFTQSVVRVCRLVPWAQQLLSRAHDARRCRRIRRSRPRSRDGIQCRNGHALAHHRNRMGQAAIVLC